MRACAACYYYRANPLNREEGECMNRPPFVIKVDQDDGTFVLVNARPNVDAKDYCAFFVHRDEVKTPKAAAKAGQQGQKPTGPHNRPPYTPKGPVDQPQAASGPFTALGPARARLTGHE